MAKKKPGKSFGQLLREKRIEKGFSLRKFRDLRAEYPEGDVLGAIYFNDKRIAIDQSLVPEEFPAMRGRYRFGGNAMRTTTTRRQPKKAMKLSSARSFIA